MLGLDCKIYQASTSELFRGTPDTSPQNENTIIDPVSPYGVAKLYAHQLCKVYRQAYDMFISCGILFNHESILKNSPIIIKDESEQIDVVPIEDIFKSDKHKYEGIIDLYKNKFIWNGNDWTKILNGTCYKKINKKVKLIQTRQSCYESTLDHVVFDENNKEIKTKDVNIGDRLFNFKYPSLNNNLNNNNDLVKFIGFVVGDGHISKDGKIRLTGVDKNELVSYANLLCNIFGWSYRLNTYGCGSYDNCKKDVYQLDINNDRNFGIWLRKNIYTKRSNEKRIPKFILNSNNNIKKCFIDGYYDADGRKSGNEIYKYKGFTTKSATLCLGLILLFNSINNQQAKVKCEYRDGNRYYYCQFRKGDKINKKGNHLLKDLNEVIKIIDSNSEDGWFYDIQTESKTFTTGANLVKIHNSPRRGKNFVTRKITLAVNDILRNKQKYLYLGNLEAKRDWGYAPEYVEGMWRMLQQDKPDDYILATGETHTIKEFCEEAFKLVGLDWKDYVKFDERQVRPNEVDLLCGNANKAREKLGWFPKVKYKELVKIMIDADVNKIIKKNDKVNS